MGPLLLQEGADLHTWMHAFSLSFTSSDRLLQFASHEQTLPNLKTVLVDFFYQTHDKLVIVAVAMLLEDGGTTGGWS